MARKRMPGERWRCGDDGRPGCGAQLVGALTIKGKVAPIELAPDEQGRGNVWLGRRADGTVICATLSGLLVEEAKLVGIPLRLNHFAYCPERESYDHAERAAEAAP